MQGLVLTEPVSVLGADAAREIARSRRHRAVESCFEESGAAPYSAPFKEPIIRGPGPISPWRCAMGKLSRRPKPLIL